MSKIKFKPLGDNILIKPGEVETKTKSGIFLTEDSAEKPKWGTVVALGNAEGKLLMDGSKFEFSVKVGNKVYWRFGGSEIELDGDKYLVMKESELLGIEE
jgi:chaperonin GroES